MQMCKHFAPYSRRHRQQKQQPQSVSQAVGRKGLALPACAFIFRFLAGRVACVKFNKAQVGSRLCKKDAHKDDFAVAVAVDVY